MSDLDESSLGWTLCSSILFESVNSGEIGLISCGI